MANFNKDERDVQLKAIIFLLSLLEITTDELDYLIDDLDLLDKVRPIVLKNTSKNDLLEHLKET